MFGRVKNGSKVRNKVPIFIRKSLHSFQTDNFGSVRQGSIEEEKEKRREKDREREKFLKKE